MIRINNAPWIHHDGGLISSIDFHPEGNKLATAGHGKSTGTGLLAIWDITNIWDEGDETNVRNESGKLASIPFSKCVNCVRWSRAHKGRFLATCGDEPEITIWEFKGSIRSEGSIGAFKGPSVREKYSAVHKLYGHEMDVLHIEWSHNGWYLASCSADGKVIIWDARNFPMTVVILDEKRSGHSDIVQGLSWDPIGKYLSTCSIDKTVKIWNSDAWNCVKTITEPFSQSARSAMFMRMDWSPDGSFLVLPGAMNNGGPTAQLVTRHDFSYKKDLVGHRKAVVSVRFCPKLIKYVNGDQELKVSLLAMGSRDRSLSMWCIPRVDRPLVVIENIFKQSLLDLSWSEMKLATCSSDGTIKLLDLGNAGNMLSVSEMGQICEKKYGYCPRIYSDAILESPSKQPKVVDDIDEYRQIHKTAESTEAPRSSSISSHDQRSLAPEKSMQTQLNQMPTRNPLEPAQVQMEFRTKSGKKKITPVYLGPLDDAQTNVMNGHSIAQPVQESTPALSATSKSQPKNVADLNQSVTSTMDDAMSRKRLGTFESLTIDPKRNRLNSTDSLPVLVEKPVLRSIPEICVAATKSSTGENVMPLPIQRKQIKAQVSGQIGLAESIVAIQVDNEFDVSCSMKISKITAYKGEESEKAWESYTSNVISIVEANSLWVALTSFQSTLMVYETNSGRLSFELAMDAPVSALHLNENYCLVISSVGVVTTLNLTEQRQIMSRTIASLLNTPQESRITLKALASDGMPIISFDDSRSYIFSKDLNGWLVMEDSHELTEKNSSALELIPRMNPHGILAKVLQTSRSLHGSIPAGIASAMEEKQFEKSMNAAKSMNSGLEYRLILNLYVQRLVEQRNEQKLADLLNELNSSEKICGIPTSRLLSDITPLITDLNIDES